MGTITVTNLGKAYKKYQTRWGRLAEWILPFAKPRHTLKWVMQGVSFTVRPGEAVGILGMNGAGKSTLLKMITGTTQPTTGSVNITGRVSAMLELGMGFHPDFTGRQNAIMTGQLLGMSIEEITNLMPEIEAFAEIGDYMNQPVRVYSSGMQMRVAFSVATARRPDVLIVDEALSVGDAYFQLKSFDRIRNFRESGTTLLIVSHDKHAIQSICNRAILLEDGKVILSGKPEDVIDYYNAHLTESKDNVIHQLVIAEGITQTISGSGKVRILECVLLNVDGHMVKSLYLGELATLKVSIIVEKEIPESVLGYMIKDQFGQPVFGTNTHHLDKVIKPLNLGDKITFLFTFVVNLGPGNYSISVALHSGESHMSNNYEWRDLAIVFNVVNPSKPYFLGVAWLPPSLEVLYEE